MEHSVLYPDQIIFSGIYSIDQSLFDLGLVLGAGTVGFFMRLAGFPFLPTVLGVVLGYLVESNFRRSLVLSGGDHAIFLEDPISLGLLIVAGIFILGSLSARMWVGWRSLRGGSTSGLV